MSPSIGLAQAIERLREELDDARREGEGHEIGIEIVEAEVELLLEVHKEGSGKSGVNFGVVSVGADGKVGSKDTHRITLKLAVTRPDGRNLSIASRNRPVPEDDGTPDD
ncbi:MULTISPECIES: trypco2 family protein [Nocardiopsis]|uniref:Trypsin-co-occurring domain-containing protein n=1 Tax=Nocardiopsis sinuspersici TaxID=501010 RepID=A0A1V3C5R1_9ACTN|nr:MULTISPECIES: trypco2 family protein [Nocardiopsis]OOC56134.1 hypothetical protein NOSIN_21795 [Nocardiopsis sinuspersici]